MIKKMLLLVLITIAIQAYAQKSTKPVLNEQSIVRGEDGLVYPFAIWKKLMSSGKYSLRTRNTSTEQGEPEYLIFKLTDEQRIAYFNKIPKPKKSDSFIEGDKFKVFKVSDINGNKFDLREQHGKVIVLNFWFINCPPCKEEIPNLNDLVAEYKDNKDVVFVALAIDDKYRLKEFLKDRPFDYNIIDNARFISDKYGVKNYPTHVVIDKNGIIKFSTLGLASNTIYWIKKSIDESLSVN